MSDLFWLTDAQMARLAPYLPKAHGKPRGDDATYLKAHRTATSMTVRKGGVAA